MSALASASTLALVSASPLAPALACVGVDVGVDDGVGVGVLASNVPRFQVFRHLTGVGGGRVGRKPTGRSITI